MLGTTIFNFVARMYLRGNLGGWYLVYCSQSKIGVKFDSLFINIAFTFTFFWFNESKLRSIDCCPITLLFPALFKIWSMLKLLDRIIISAFRDDSALLTKRYWLESVIFRPLFFYEFIKSIFVKDRVITSKCGYCKAKYFVRQTTEKSKHRYEWQRIFCTTELVLRVQDFIYVLAYAHCTPKSKNENSSPLYHRKWSGVSLQKCYCFESRSSLNANTKSKQQRGGLSSMVPCMFFFIRRMQIRINKTTIFCFIFFDCLCFQVRKHLPGAGQNVSTVEKRQRIHTEIMYPIQFTFFLVEIKWTEGTL